QTVVATPNSGYTFVNWTENGTQVSTSASYTFTVGGNRTLVANFSTGGSATPSIPTPSSGAINQPISLVLGWSSAGAVQHDLYISTSSTFVTKILYTGSGTTQSISGLANNTIYYWKVISYSMNSTPSGWSPVWTFRTQGSTNYLVSASSIPTAGGTITGSGSYQSGQSCTITATANSGYNFVNWTEDGVEVSTSMSYTFTVGASRTLVANFVPASSAITVSFYKPFDWSASNVYIWAWNSGGANLFTAWPGVLMKDIGNGWFSYTFPDTENNINVVFSNNGVVQTVDILGVTQSACYQSSGLNGVKLTVTSVACPSTGIGSLKMEQENIKLAPNPSRLLVKVTSPDVLDRIDICDISGRIIRNEVVNSETTTLNVSSLQNGIYIVKGYSNGKVFVQRLIKE
ncbi:MAG: starch-binding protein, partial [Bacteroidales bacterium]